MAFNGADGGDAGVDPEIQRFIAIETQKAKFQANVNTFTGIRCKNYSIFDNLGIIMKYS